MKPTFYATALTSLVFVSICAPAAFADYYYDNQRRYVEPNVNQRSDYFGNGHRSFNHGRRDWQRTYRQQRDFHRDGDRAYDPSANNGRRLAYRGNWNWDQHNWND